MSILAAAVVGWTVALIFWAIALIFLRRASLRLQEASQTLTATVAELHKVIDQRVEAGTFSAVGDNCAGWKGEVR